jgi:hypothetical protein
MSDKCDMFITLPLVGTAINLLVILAFAAESNLKNSTTLILIGVYLLTSCIFHIIPFLSYYYPFKMLYDIEDLMFWRKPAKDQIESIKFTLLDNEDIEAIPLEEEIEIVSVNEKKEEIIN